MVDDPGACVLVSEWGVTEVGPWAFCVWAFVPASTRTNVLYTHASGAYRVRLVLFHTGLAQITPLLQSPARLFCTLLATGASSFERSSSSLLVRYNTRITEHTSRRADKRVPTREEILWAVALLVALGVGFAIGAALWEGVAGPPGPLSPILK